MISNSSLDYQVPSWSTLPSYNFYLQVIKDGSIIGNLLLPKKQFILFGKQQDICDVVLQNPLISRKHAVLQFKQNDTQPHLFDLNSTHGVFVNDRKLPSRIYHRVNCFDTIQFGGSNKQYLLRCKELESQKEKEEEEVDVNQFQKAINQSRESMSKSELKEKYLDLLENDPYHNSNHENRKFKGKDDKQKEGEGGVTWGMSDEVQLYNYRNQHEYPLEPDLLRRLPLNDQRIIDKINELEEVFNKYQQVESQLRQLVNKQKKQYGLEDKLVTKKGNLQKKLIETQESLQKHENYIRVHLFGEQTTLTYGNQKKVKEIDTFEGDEYYDRTLDKNEEIDLEALRNQHVENSTEDYYKLKNRLEQLLKKQEELNKRLLQNCTETGVNTEQMDDYQLYLYQSEKKLRKQNYEKIKIEIGKNNELIEITRGKLSQIQPATVNKTIEFEKDVPVQSNKVQKSTKQKEKMKQNKDEGIQNALKQLQKLSKEEQEIKDDKQLFKIYEKKEKIKSVWRRDRDEVQGYQNEEEERREETMKKKPKIFPHRKQEQEQEDFEDLTKFDS